MTFREDESRIRRDNTAENLAVLRHIALNTLQVLLMLMVPEVMVKNLTSKI